MENKNYGFIQPVPDERDFIFGGVTKLKGEPLTDGHWLQFLPENEVQKNDWIDSFNCTAFGSSNCLEILFQKVFSETKNFSDRFIGIIANTLPPGNSPKIVIDAIRKQGLVNEVSLPFTGQTIEEYYSPKPPTPELTKEAREFLIKHGIGYELVTPTIENLKNALCFSPLGVAVKAWSEKDGLYYFPESSEFNHWACLADFEEGKSWTILDSYYPYIKKVGWNEKFGYVLRYWLGPGEKEQVTILQKILNILGQILNIQSLLIKVQKSVPELPIPASPTPPPPIIFAPKSKIEACAVSISEAEGYGTPKAVTITKNFNPGAIKSFDGTFKAFNSYAEGFSYLCGYLV